MANASNIKIQIATEAQGPKAIVLLPGDWQYEETKHISQQVEAWYPDWHVLFLPEGTRLFNRTPRGDFEEEQPITVLEGQAVLDYMEELERESARDLE